VMTVGLCVCEHISRTTSPIFTKCFVHATCVHGSVILQHCDMLCTSGFMDDVMFVHNGKKTIRYKDSKLWNNLPGDLKNTTSLFKHRLKSYLLHTLEQ